jgi:DHA1 family multidrug resistance protein-like MFS transporter
LAIGHGIAVLGYQLSYGLMPLLVIEIGVSDPQEAALWTGILLMISPMLVGMMLPLWNILARRTGRKVQLLRAISGNTITLFLVGFANSVGYLVATNIGMGLLGGSWPQTMILATEGVPPNMVGQAVGLIQSVELIVGAFGPSIGGALGDTWGLRPNFFLGAGLNLIVILMIALLYRPLRSKQEGEEPVEEPDDEPEEKGSMRECLRLPGFLPLIALFFLFQFFGPVGLRGIIPLRVVQLAEEGAPIATLAGFTLSLANITGAVAAQLVGRKGDRVPPGKLTAGLLVFAGFSTILIALAQSPQQLLVLWAIYGLSTGGIITSMYSLTGRMIPSRWLGPAYALVSNALMLAAMGRAAQGFLASIDLRLSFVASGGVLLLLALGLVILLRRMQFSPPPAPAAAQDEA